jgi:hypothetical protein
MDRQQHEDEYAEMEALDSERRVAPGRRVLIAHNVRQDQQKPAKRLESEADELYRRFL